MSPQRREQLQLSILVVLDANHTRFGLPIDAVTLHASGYGFPALKREQVEIELEYLAEKGLTQTVGKTLEPANRAWARTAAGRDYLSERGKAAD